MGDHIATEGTRGVRNGSVIRKRVLGGRLRLMREDAGLSLEIAAPALDFSTSTVSRIETGMQAPRVHAVRSMLDLYDVGGTVWEELVALTREVRQKGWWRAYGLGNDSYVGFDPRTATGASRSRSCPAVASPCATPRTGRCPPTGSPPPSGRRSPPACARASSTAPKQAMTALRRPGASARTRRAPAAHRRRRGGGR